MVVDAAASVDESFEAMVACKTLVIFMLYSSKWHCANIFLVSSVEADRRTPKLETVHTTRPIIITHLVLSIVVVVAKRSSSTVKLHRQFRSYIG
jgi:hypothetical protein